MSVRRVMGTEVEYGISVQGQPLANPMVASSQVVNAYASATVKARRARWDFEEESPLRDARGFDMARQIADPTQLTDEDLGLANVILTNGARLYVDHAHPEYSTPEVTNPRDCVIWDKAGERVTALALRMLGSMSQHLRVIVGLLDDLTLKDMETRVANWLLKHCPHPMDDHEVEIKLDRTKRVLAAEFGATSETLSRTLAKFRDKKLLRLKGNAITITQPLELARVLQRHLGEL